MAKIFVGQTGVELQLQTGVDFTVHPITSAKVKYKTPKGIAGEFEAAPVAGEERKGMIGVSFSDSVKFEQEGEHLVWPYLVYQDGRTGIGERAGIHVYKEGLA